MDEQLRLLKRAFRESRGRYVVSVGSCSSAGLGARLNTRMLVGEIPLDTVLYIVVGIPVVYALKR
jgi:hypothetical protein